jgi:predicted enzyme related to lactoylglutathione lyase
MSYDNGRFVWFELVTDQADRAKAFYAEVLGWQHGEMEMPGGMKYPLITAGGVPLGGYAPPPADLPPHWVSYVSVDDVDAAAKRVVEAGGKTLMDAFDAPGVGRMQPVADPEGAAFFLFHADNGDSNAAQGQGAFHWNELMCEDPEAAAAFYAKVVGYSADTMEMPQGPYRILKNGENMRGGIMKLPVDAPAHWLQYFQVDDCDAAVARAKSNGGEVLGEIMEVEGVGRFAHIRDPLGAHVGLIKPAA